jgi:hypothetical protein
LAFNSNGGFGRHGCTANHRTEQHAPADAHGSLSFNAANVGKLPQSAPNRETCASLRTVSGA